MSVEFKGQMQPRHAKHNPGEGADYSEDHGEAVGGFGLFGVEGEGRFH